MIEISARDLQKRVASVHTKRQKLYDTVFDRCVKGKLQYAAKHGLPFCMANIQTFMPGLPAFDPVSCSMHIRDALQRKGFHVQLLPRNNLLISWLTTRTSSGSDAPPPLLLEDAASTMVPYNFAAFKKPNGKRVMFV